MFWSLSGKIDFRKIPAPGFEPGIFRVQRWLLGFHIFPKEKSTLDIKAKPLSIQICLQPDALPLLS